MFCLLKKMITHKMKRSKLHKIGTSDVFKISLFCFDNKRCLLGDGINILVCFHKDIKSQ